MQVLKLCADMYVYMPDPLGKTARPNLQPLLRQGPGQPGLTACGAHVPQPAGKLAERPQVGWRAWKFVGVCCRTCLTCWDRRRAQIRCPRHGRAWLPLGLGCVC